MIPRVTLAAFALVLTTTATQSESLSAQTEQEDVHLRNDCRLAAQILGTGHPDPHYQWALDIIATCEETGGPVLAGLWHRPSADSADLNRLFLSSYRLRDSRITAAVIEAAGDPALPQLMRLNAIRVMAGHAFPNFLLAISDLLRLESDSVRYLFPRVDHVTVRNGGNPVGTSTIRMIVAALKVLENDPDGQVAHAASRTHRQLCLRLRTQDCNPA